MNVWWQSDPLTMRQSQLLELVLAAHDRSARRQNISTVTAINATNGSGDFLKGLAAALLTLGGIHAPLEPAVRVLQHPESACQLLRDGCKVPGWGNSFWKGEPDPEWASVAAQLDADFPEMAARLNGITKLLHASGRNLYPNPGAYTAAATLVLGIPPALAGWLFVRGRLDAWADLVNQNLKV